VAELATGAACLAVVPFFDPGEIPRSVWLLLAATGVVHGFYTYWLASAYEHGELTVVYPIARTTPAFLPLLAVPLLGESLSAGGLAGIALVVAGIWLVGTDGRFSRRALARRGTLYALLTLAATVAYSLIDKRAMETLSLVHWSGPAPRAIVFFALMYVLHLPVFAALSRKRVSGVSLRGLLRARWPSIVAVVAASFGSYGLILEAMRTAPVSYVVAVRQISVAFAVILALVWLRERPGRPRVVGSLATVVGVALIALIG
jgi:drug/metabolite transporter (DMT)-like permease